MNNIFKTCVNSLLRSHHCLQNQQGLVNVISPTRSLYTSPVLRHPTKKRRKTHPFFWLQDKYKSFYDENLTSDNEQFFQKFLEDKYSLSNKTSPLKEEPWDTNEEFTDGSARCGLIARKMGKAPMWTKDGRRIMATCLMVSDNHVIKYHTPENYAKHGRPVDVARYPGMGCIVVGSDSQDPREFTAEYNGLFTESGVMPKKKLTRFFITPNARMEPGTPLVASHFRPGMYVDIYGKSKWLGFVSLRRRFQLKLGRKTHGNTKNHNRIGSIGRGRKHAGPLKGKRMPGTHGNERVIIAGIKVLRVNTKYNLIYVMNACVPGDFGCYVNVMDSRIQPKKLTAEKSPPFPTTTLEDNSKLPEDMYDPMIHLPSQPSIVFEITEEERKAAAAAAKRLALGPKMGKTAQKIR